MQVDSPSGTCWKVIPRSLGWAYRWVFAVFSMKEIVEEEREGKERKGKKKKGLERWLRG